MDVRSTMKKISKQGQAGSEQILRSFEEWRLKEVDPQTSTYQNREESRGGGG